MDQSEAEKLKKVVWKQKNFTRRCWHVVGGVDSKEGGRVGDGFEGGWEGGRQVS